MRRATASSRELQPPPLKTSPGCCVGTIIGITESGQAVVDFPGNQQAPIAARSVVTVDGKNAPDLLGVSVLLVFESGDMSLPIIAGLVHETISPAPGTLTTRAERAQPDFAVIDGRRVILEAKNEITLRCGKASITLRKDGKIVVKGTDLVSRASRTNKVKGSSVAIN